MSAYICDNRTISALAKAFEQYSTREWGYQADDYQEPCGIIVNIADIHRGIGQSLLNQNYKSVNYRYHEETPVPDFEYEDVYINEGIVYGCINNYEYQACETPDYFETKIHESMNKLKEAMLVRFINKAGMEYEWGYPENIDAKTGEPLPRF